MDSNRIKNLAAGVRTALRAEAEARLDAVLAEGSTARLEHARQVARLEERLRAEGREAVVDSAAYTWFNRLCALRYMDSHGYTSTPAVTPRPGSTQPAILADALQGILDPEYPVGPELRASLASMPAERVYEELLTAVCAYYAAPMPYLFSDDVASGLLMPQGLLAQDSILSRIVSELDDEVCQSVEVLGWLYQFYIAERKDEYFASKRKAQAADIAPATQLFTPEWIVRYLTENSLGRLWMLNNPGSSLADSMEYYIAPEGEKEHLLISSADEIRVLDPACGSGHILVYAFDLLYRMYEEEGYLPEDIPARILQSNLSGLEIDRRAAEIASFALEMKALERDPRFLDWRIDADIRVLEPVKLTADELQLVPHLAERTSLLEAMGHMDEVGSLYVPDTTDAFIIRGEIEAVENSGTLVSSALLGKLRTMLANVEALSRTFHVVVANPPYMGSGNMNPWMSAWVKDHYPDEKGDFCTCFIERSFKFAKESGYASLITMHSWMFLGSYEKMREKMIANKGIVSMAHLGARAFDAIGGEVVQTTSTVLLNKHIGGKGAYVRLVDLDSSEAKRSALLEAIRNPECGWLYRADADDFKAIPGWPIAYWASEGLREAFRDAPMLSNVADVKKGMSTGENARFVRLWWEVPLVAFSTCIFSHEESLISKAKWVPYNKGGAFRKWYGNNTEVLNWSHDGEDLKAFNGAVLRNQSYYFLPSVTWSALSSGQINFRYKDAGGIHDGAGASFFEKKQPLIYLLACLNSSVIAHCAELLSPTLNFEIGQVSSYPVVLARGDTKERVLELSSQNVKITRLDWDSFETSWDFAWHPLLPEPGQGAVRIAEMFADWEAECRERFDTLKANEEELNRIFARIYNMEGEVPIEVPDDKVSVRLADRARDARSLVSYGVGCMLGRYSTYEPGLVLADQGQTQADFREKVPHAGFPCDEDNVLPVLDEEWFEDDIVTGFRAWLADAFGAGTLEENVSWLEESLGRDLRSYFCKDFYADHVKVYQKRPIYWMFSSPKGAFRCLVYMHRYQPGTVGTILSGYLREYEDKLRTRIQVLSADGASARDIKEADKLRAALAECEQWERDVVYPLAHERVEIDLDDGVKVNYNKFPHALAKITGLSDWK